MDYNKDPVEVYKDFLEFCLRRYRSLDMICRPWASDLRVDHALPTWIPRLVESAYQKRF